MVNETIESLRAQLAEARIEASHAAGLYRAEAEHRREARAEVERLTLQNERLEALASAFEPSAIGEALVECNEKLERAEARLAKVVEALAKWEDAESQPDCVACAVLDAALPDAAAKEKPKA